ncbi:hypothetical protein V1477_012665 [Vespula maculifrons]|uniref:Maturase n=1 Tax=Vespula maculifrons TaxID=7453 RepID=A0ABD2BTS0_VESMC
MVGLEGRQQRRSFDILLQLPVQLCFGLRRENLEIFVEAVRAIINEQTKVAKWGWSAWRDDNKDGPLTYFYSYHCGVGIVGLEGRQQRRSFDILIQLPVQLCFGLRRENLEISAEAVRAIINEQSAWRDDNKAGPLTYLYSYRFSCVLVFDERTQKFPRRPFVRLLTNSCGVGIVGLEGRQQSRSFDILIQLPVQLCFGLRRENSEISAEAVRAIINEQSAWRDDNKAGPLTYLYSYRFSCVLVFDERTQKFPRRPFVRLLTNSCGVGIVGLEGRQQSRSFDILIQLPVQLCFGLRRENSEISAEAVRAIINEQSAWRDDNKAGPLTYLYSYRFSCVLVFDERTQKFPRRPFVRLLTNSCGVGIVGLEGRQQSRSFDILLQLPVQLCFGLRRENSEISAEAVRAIINEQSAWRDDNKAGPLTYLYSYRFSCVLVFDERTQKFPRRPFVRLLTNSCGVGIVGLEGRQQSRSFDILIQLPVQLCFGLRRENSEISAEAVRAIINEQLPVQLCFGLRRENSEISAEAVRAIINEQSAWRDDNKAGPLTYLYSYRFSCVLVFDERTQKFPRRPFVRLLTNSCGVGIVGLEGRQQSRSFDILIQLPVQLCFGLRRENLEISAEAVRAIINEQSAWRDDNKAGPLTYLYSYRFSCVLVFDERTQKFPRRPFVRLLTNSCGVGIVGLEGRQQSRSFDILIQLPVQLCFGLRRENSEISAEAVRAIINEQSAWRDDNKAGPLTYLYSYRFSCVLVFDERTQKFPRRPFVRLLTNSCGVGIVGLEGRQQSRSFDILIQLPVQLCFGLRRENSEISAEAVRAIINEQVI